MTADSDGRGRGSGRDAVHGGAHDYVIVGAGSAGCVLALRLSEDPDVRVLVLEGGVSDRRTPLIHVPAGLIKLPKSYDYRYVAEPDKTRDGRVDAWSGGRVLGGSSSINGMMWVRGPRADFDEWAAMGCDGWDYQSVLPYFRRSETYEPGGDPTYRGHDGPLHVSARQVAHPLTDDFVRSAEAAGHPFNADYNGERIDGVSYGQFSVRRGLRQSTASAYLRRAMRRPNVDVIVGAAAERIVFDDGRATGVTYTRKGDRRTAMARREVIVSAGSFGSPKLLLLSGVGPEDRLRSLAIPVVSDVPGVGSNLQDHLPMLMQYEVDVPTLNTDTSPKRMIRHAAQYIANGRGPAASAMGHAMIFGGAARGSEIPSYQTLFNPFAVPNRILEKHAMNNKTLVATSAVTLYPCLLRPYATGSVRLRSADPAEQLVIDHEAMSDERDVAALIAAGREVRNVMSQDPIARHVVRETNPGPAVNTDEEWAEYIRHWSLRSNHQCGTCKMGSDEMAVVDPQLRVRGVEGLRVIDASVMPTVPRGNTNAATIMVAERGADHIRGLR